MFSSFDIKRLAALIIASKWRQQWSLVSAAESSVLCEALSFLEQVNKRQMC